MGLRLLRLGPAATWLPEWKQGRLLVGSAPTADVQLPGSPLLPFHCLIELAQRAPVALVHDLARQGDVTDAAGRPAPPEGLPVRAGERFRVGGCMIALVQDAADPSTIDTTPIGISICVICRTPAKPEAARRGRSVAGAFVCPGCLGVIDLDPAGFPGYELLAWIGAGAVGGVYLAHEPARERLVAIKVIRLDGVVPSKAAARFQRECGILARLAHPAIMRVHDAGAFKNTAFLVCEFLRGGDAYARLNRQGPLPPVEVARMGRALADALAYAHAQGVIHRDVKPANVLLELDGSPKLSDFGLAKEIERIAPGAVSTGSGVGLGTLAYAAPEQIRDARRAGPPADVFALGATLYHLATGRTTRSTVNLAALHRTLDTVPPRASAVDPNVPEWLGVALEQALAPVPHKRVTAAVLRDLLAREGGRA